MSGFGGHMAEYRQISIDRFDKTNQKSVAFFLSHCHRDHMVGLDQPCFLKCVKSRNEVFLYCSEVTKLLLLSEDVFKPLGPYIRVLKVGIPEIVTLPDPECEEFKSVVVTALPAGHCPGSVMFLFEGKEGRALYTGDFRWEKNYATTMPALCVNGHLKEIDSMYIDTTFCVPEAFYIPSRDDCLLATASLVLSWLSRSSHHYVHVSSRTKYGHEPLLCHLAKQAKTQIHTSRQKVQIYEQITELRGVFTEDPTARIHACSWKDERDSESRLPCGHSPDKGSNSSKLEIPAVLVVRPSTMWFTAETSRLHQLVVSPASGRGLHRVCYSFHSSFSELRDLVSLLRPRRVYPNVLPASDNDWGQVKARLQKFLTYQHSHHVFHEGDGDTAKPLGLLKRKRIQTRHSPADLEGLIFDSPEKPKKPRHKIEDMEEVQQSSQRSGASSLVSPTKSDPHSSYQSTDVDVDMFANSDDDDGEKEAAPAKDTGETNDKKEGSLKDTREINDGKEGTLKDKGESSNEKEGSLKDKGESSNEKEGSLKDKKERSTEKADTGERRERSNEKADTGESTLKDIVKRCDDKEGTLTDTGEGIYLEGSESFRSYVSGDEEVPEEDQVSPQHLSHLNSQDDLETPNNIDHKAIQRKCLEHDDAEAKHLCHNSDVEMSQDTKINGGKANSGGESKNQAFTSDQKCLSDEKASVESEAQRSASDGSKEKKQVIDLIISDSDSDADCTITKTFMGAKPVFKGQKCCFYCSHSEPLPWRKAPGENLIHGKSSLQGNKLRNSPYPKTEQLKFLREKGRSSSQSVRLLQKGGARDSTDLVSADNKDSDDQEKTSENVHAEDNVCDADVEDNIEGEIKRKQKSMTQTRSGSRSGMSRHGKVGSPSLPEVIFIHDASDGASGKSHSGSAKRHSINVPQHMRTVKPVCSFHGGRRSPNQKRSAVSEESRQIVDERGESSKSHTDRCASKEIVAASDRVFTHGSYFVIKNMNNTEKKHYSVDQKGKQTIINGKAGLKKDSDQAFTVGDMHEKDGPVKEESCDKKDISTEHAQMSSNQNWHSAKDDVARGKRDDSYNTSGKDSPVKKDCGNREDSSTERAQTSSNQNLHPDGDDGESIQDKDKDDDVESSNGKDISTEHAQMSSNQNNHSITDDGETDKQDDNDDMSGKNSSVKDRSCDKKDINNAQTSNNQNQYAVSGDGAKGQGKDEDSDATLPPCSPNSTVPPDSPVAVDSSDSDCKITFSAIKTPRKTGRLVGSEPCSCQSDSKRGSFSGSSLKPCCNHACQKMCSYGTYKLLPSSTLHTFGSGVDHVAKRSMKHLEGSVIDLTEDD